MPISATCRNCGRSYSVKDEHAGKKFRCQGCQETVSVPVPRAAAYDADDWEADDYEDDFGDPGYDDDDYGDYESREPLPAPRRPAKKKKPAAKSKRPKRRSSSNSGSVGAAAGKIFGGLFVGLVVMGIVFRAVSAVGLGGSWESYTTPDGNITVQMPGKVKSVPVRQMVAGGQSYGAQRRNIACIVVIEPMPPEAKTVTEEELMNILELGIGFQGATNVNRSTYQGRTCLRFDQPTQKGIHTTCMAFVHKEKIYTLNFAYKGSQGSSQEKFFNSVEFN
jgi:hypothetical protein